MLGFIAFWASHHAVQIVLATIFNVVFAIINYGLLGKSLWMKGELFDGLFLRLEAKLNKRKRSNDALRLRGLILLILGIILSLVFAALLKKLIILMPYSGLVEAIIIALFIPSMRLFFQSRKLERFLKADNVDHAKSLLSSYAERDISSLDNHGLIRTQMEYVSERFAVNVVAPLFWFMCLGIYGFIIAITLTQLYTLFGHRFVRYEHFGYCMVKSYTTIHWVPTQLAAFFFIMASAFLPYAHPFKAWSQMVQTAGRSCVPIRATPISSVAGALHITLGGPRVYQSHTIDDEWFGLGTAKITRDHLRHFYWLYFVANSMFLLVLMVLIGMV
jgi:adenosylcobinamide-phosphate synthase